MSTCAMDFAYVPQVLHQLAVKEEGVGNQSAHLNIFSSRPLLSKEEGDTTTTTTSSETYDCLLHQSSPYGHGMLH